MTDRGKGRLVYSTGVGAICPGCGWPERDCTCSQSTATESIPTRIVAKLRMEKKGRGGKTVVMPHGGQLTIRTAAIEVKQDDPRRNAQAFCQSRLAVRSRRARRSRAAQCQALSVFSTATCCCTR
jgi:hypothetical protein